MKRREMIDLLEDIIEDCHNGPHYELGKLNGDRLLTMIEKAGMLPPKIVNPDLEGKYESHIDFCDNSRYPNCVDYEKKYYVYQWESEDD